MFRRWTVGERVRTNKGAVRSRNSQRKLNFCQNSGPHIVLKLPRDPNGHVSSPTQYLFSGGHCLHPRIACSPLVTAYSHAFFFIHKVTHLRISTFRLVTSLILSMTGYISQLHLLGSSLVKAIYYRGSDNEAVPHTPQISITVLYNCRRIFFYIINFRFVYLIFLFS